MNNAAFEKIIPWCAEKHGVFNMDEKYTISKTCNHITYRGKIYCDVHWNPSHEILHGVRVVAFWKPKVRVLMASWVNAKYM